MRVTRGSLLGAVAVVFGLVLVDGAHAQESEAETVRVEDATKGRDLDATQTVRVRIRNDLNPARSVTVSVVSLTRPEYVLGAVHSNGVREWEIDTRLYPDGFRLVAANGARLVRVSREVDVMNQARVKWDLGIDFLRVERVEGGTR